MLHDDYDMWLITPSNGAVWPCSPSDVDSVGLTAEDKKAFVVIDYDRSAMILGGSAFTDVEAIKKALAALTAPSILSRDALPLSARLVCYSTILSIMDYITQIAQNQHLLKFQA
jgi:hypothetical protein